MAVPVPDSINFAAEEQKIIALWKEIDAFKTSLQQSKGKPRFTFYDGPPFATGLPHYGHILTGTMKDIVTRYAHQSGFHVERRFGWDTHGLPVEYEIDKTLNIKSPDDVKKLGIANYNAECRKIVMRYAKEWQEIVSRVGRWIDFENDYKTLYPWFMESVWWAFKELFNKGLVYKGVKVMPYSTACNTPLSNFESGQNYKEVQDPAVIVSFPLDENPDVSLIAWTTTPWTLPSNMALCVNPNLTYVKLKENTTGKLYIMMEARLEILFKKPTEYTVLEKFKGECLKGKGYSPLFPYFVSHKSKGAFHIYCDTYVTEDAGTGVVHQAPYFGEDDFRICLANNVISKDQEMICPLDANGCFVKPVEEFLGQYVKDADKDIIKHLKATGRLVHHGQVKHSYPFCWRSETPLIYRAIPSWFIRVEQMANQLLDNIQNTYWVPEFVKEKRFANWLRDARDWAVSRNRYWGTPIPLWMSQDGEEIVCIGSIKELEELTGQKITDLHRESIDDLIIPSKTGRGNLKRVSEVFDCWFESGSMPYAQAHYPFENKRDFEDGFPADFIAEGVDQTRGWFYTLLVLSTALFGKPPFKNLIANGLVLASDGQKMSKRKKNYPDPMDVVNKFGADALRLYLINSPVVRGDTLRFKEEGVRDVLKDVFLPWFNAYRFLIQSIGVYEKDTGRVFKFNEKTFAGSDNIMDQWIMSFTQSLVIFVKQEMAAYRLYTVVPKLVKLVDQLTNWYVRMNRKRLKGEGGVDDWKIALETLFSVLYTMNRVLAPFTPFITEMMFQNLRNIIELSEENIDNRSIHFLMLPQVQKSLLNPTVERKVSYMQTAIEMGRLMRDRRTLPIKYPLPEMILIHSDQNCLNDIVSLKGYILEELNIRRLTVTTDKEKFSVHLKAEPDIKRLGQRLLSASKPVFQAIRELDDAALQNLLSSGTLEVARHLIEPSDVRIAYKFSGNLAKELTEKYEAHAEGGVLGLLDVSPDESMLNEGIAREVINRVQKLRKKALLDPTDDITVYIKVLPESHKLRSVVDSHMNFIESSLKVPLKAFPIGAAEKIIITDSQEWKDAKLEITLTEQEGAAQKRASLGNENVTKKVKLSSKTTSTREINVSLVNEMETKVNGSLPFCRFINVELCEAKAELGATSQKGTVLLENPIGDFHLSYDSLLKQVKTVFGLQGKRVKLSKSRERKKALDSMTKEDILACHSKTLYSFVF